MILYVSILFINLRAAIENEKVFITRRGGV